MYAACMRHVCGMYAATRNTILMAGRARDIEMTLARSRQKLFQMNRDSDGEHFPSMRGDSERTH